MKSENMKQRKLYGVPMIPFGLLAGFVGKKEVRITELSEEGFAFRTAKKIPGPEKIRLCFYDLKKTDYEEMTIQTPEIEEGDAESFFQNYIVWMEQVGEREQYRELVRKLLGQYSHYIQLKLTEDDSGVAEALTGYPAKLDQVHAKDWEEQKQMWFAEMQKAKKSDGEHTENADLHTKNMRMERCIVSEMEFPEFAIAIDRPELYEQYSHRSLEDFIKYYWQKQHLGKYPLAQRRPDRLYIGNQFCPHLFPADEMLFALLQKAQRESLQVTVVFTCQKESVLKSMEQLLQKLDQWCDGHDRELEVIVNDWGLAGLVGRMTSHLIPILGILLNKYKKDPRIGFKQGDQMLLKENPLGLENYRKYLQDEFAIHRYEWECCGHEQEYPQGHNSLYFPFYQTNTSQYCPLYACCTTGERGRQKEPANCPQCCQDKVLLYPDHLKMVGRYNSLFALDDTLLRMPEQVEQLMKSGIDRLVVNLL